MRKYRLFVERERYKVSCAHMTVFPDGSKERLHGHNYQIGCALEITDISFQKIVPFAMVKRALDELCALWKEKVFLARHNPYHKLLQHDNHTIAFSLCDQRYELPANDVLILETDNITVETLADLAATHMCQRLGSWLKQPHVRCLEATVSEAPGQGATCTVMFQ